MFIGRKNELEQLERLYASDRFEFAVIYGRRRVGKTELINQFLKNKEAVFFTGVETNAKQNLENFSKCIGEFSSGIVTNTVFSSFQSALEYIFELSQNQRMVLCIDEYPYVARSCKSLASTLQMVIDKYKSTSKLMLILCGSSMSYMEDHVLAYKAPLFGRRTGQFKILPLEFWEAQEYFSNYSLEEKAVAYGIVGGTPQYMLQMKDTLSLEENIKNLYCNPVSAIFEEPTNLLKQEVREPAIYNAIVTAIATGASKLSEIATKVGEDTGVCATYLKNLVSLGIVKKEMPCGEVATRKTIYAIADNMFRFWYRFVPENTSLITRGATELAYSRMEPYLSEYMGSVFEEICKQYLWKRLLENRMPVFFTQLGRWWGTNPKTKSQEEVDILGVGDGNTILLGECKWTNAKVDQSVLERLIARGELFPHAKKQYYVFAKRGFTKSCLEKAETMDNVTLMKFEDMI